MPPLKPTSPVRRKPNPTEAIMPIVRDSQGRPCVRGRSPIRKKTAG